MALSLYRYPFKAMGSTCELQLYSHSRKASEKIAELAIADVKRIEFRYSRYREESVLSGINKASAAGKSIDIEPETYALLKYADTCYHQSDGLFDITSGILREAWDFKTKKIPQDHEIRTLLNRIGWDKVQISETSISFALPGMQLDFGGIGKEYAVDRAATICRQQGIKHGLVDLGGDIKIIGPHANGCPWSVGIRHPRKRGALLASIDVYRGGIASSGDYERCIIVKGKRYSHVLNPKTGWPVNGLASITVVAEQCVIAGSACTISMLKEERGKQWIDDLGLAHLWMDQQGAVGGTLSKA